MCKPYGLVYAAAAFLLRVSRIACVVDPSSSPFPLEQHRVWLLPVPLIAVSGLVRFRSFNWWKGGGRGRSVDVEEFNWDALTSKFKELSKEFSFENE